MRKIAMAAEAPYTLVYMKEQYMEMGLYALERMVRIADYTDAVMTYADHTISRQRDYAAKPLS